MSDASKKSELREWPAQRRVATKSPSALAPAWNAALALLDLIPSYRDTAKGRSKSTQIRAFLIVSGVFVVGFAGREWVPLGVAIMALALLVPLAELRKRTLRQRLKSLKSRTTITHEPMTVSFDGRRVAVMRGDAVERRVLTKAGEYAFEERQFHGKRAVLLRGKTSRKRDNIWFTSTSPARHDAEIVKDDEIDLIVRMNDEDIDSLLNSQGLA